MLTPFQSFSWSVSGGKYMQPFARIMTDWTSTNPGKYAAQQLTARPRGSRMLLFQNAEIAGRLFNHPADRLIGGRKGLWFDNGIAATAQTFGDVVEQMFLNKAELDFATFDIETSVSAWTLNPDDLAAIYADPRYATLVGTGLFPADCRNMSEETRLLFNYGSALVVDEAIRKAIIIPLYKRYPNVGWCNFADGPVTKADTVLVPEFNGHRQYVAPSSATHYAPSMYCNIGGWAQMDTRMKQPFFAMAWTTNIAKAVYRAKPTAKLMPWLAPRVLSNVLDAAHWQELIFHSCCLAGMNLLFFNYDDPSALSNWRFDNALSQYIAAARWKVWKSTVITAMCDYDTAKYVISAARLEDNSIVGRVTFKTGVNSATFNLGGKTYTVKRPIGGVGAWFHC
jgi:hypothetical protein